MCERGRTYYRFNFSDYCAPARSSVIAREPNQCITEVDLMPTRPRPVWRRRPRSRAARIAVPLAIPMALGLTLGAVLAFTGGPSSTTIQQSAAAAGASATPAVSGAAAGAPTTAGGR